VAFRHATCQEDLHSSRGLRALVLGLGLAFLALVLPLVAVSGAECVDALVMAGFGVRSRTDSSTKLGKGMRVVLVPNVALLPPEDLASILREAGVRYLEFLDYLSETPTEPDVLLTAAAHAHY
jgi:hypothetical protein